MQESIVEFKKGKNLIKFKIYNNLDELRLDFYSALENWSGRTKKFTAKSFVNYLKSKNTYGLLVFTESEWNKLNK